MLLWFFSITLKSLSNIKNKLNLLGSTVIMDFWLCWWELKGDFKLKTLTTSGLILTLFQGISSSTLEICWKRQPEDSTSQPLTELSMQVKRDTQFLITMIQVMIKKYLSWTSKWTRRIRELWRKQEPRKELMRQALISWTEQLDSTIYPSILQFFLIWPKSFWSSDLIVNHSKEFKCKAIVIFTGLEKYRLSIFFSFIRKDYLFTYF